LAFGYGDTLAAINRILIPNAVTDTARCYINAVIQSLHVYEVRPRKDKRGVDLISDVLPFGRLWYAKPDDAIGYAEHFSRSHDGVIRVYDSAGNVIETPEHTGDFKEL
jgi:hypothetical protein